MSGKIKPGTKIALGYAFAVALLAIAIAINALHVNAISGLTSRIASLRVPTAEASLGMLNGMNRSLAALRGWMLLGDDKFKAERQFAWDKEIDSSLKTLIEYSKNWTNPENLKRLDAVRRDLRDFRFSQRKVEDIAHTVENTPATKILFEKAAPAANIVVQNITRLIEIEGQQQATAERKALLGMMADVRGSMGMSLASIRAYLIGGDQTFKVEFDGHWETYTRRFRDLESNSDLFTLEQQEVFNKLIRAREVFSEYPPQMFEIREKENWNLANYWLATETAPKADRIKEIIEAMVGNQQILLEDDAINAVALTDTLAAIEWILLAAGTVILLIFGAVLARAINRDFTARVRAEEALRKSKEQLQTIYDGMVDGVLIVEGASKEFVLANPAICEMLGYTDEELWRMSLKDIRPDERLNDIQDLFSVTKERGVSSIRDIPFLRKNGSVFYADVGSRIVSYEGRLCTVGFFRDSTDRKRTEDALQQMAAGLAHEIRNPLSSISTGIDLLVRGIGNKTKLSTGLQAESIRLEKILTDFLVFSRPAKPERSLGDINSVLAELMNLLQSDNKIAKVKIEMQLDRSIEKFCFDRNRITQVLWNLARNGFESMPDEGKLTVHSQNGQEQVTISICDRGNGVSKTDIKHIFDPFFTTKKGGTGLGLAIAERIVKDHGGSIKVESEIGKGTTFQVTLPTVEQAKWRYVDVVHS